MKVMRLICSLSVCNPALSLRLTLFLLLTSASLLMLTTSCEKGLDSMSNVDIETCLLKRWMTEETWRSYEMDEDALTGERYSFYKWTDPEYIKSFTSSAEAFKAANIPEDSLKKMSTANLARTCFVYPYAIIYFAYIDYATSAIDGIFAIMNQFNGLTELQRRPSGADELLELYKSFILKADTTSRRTFDYRERHSFIDQGYLELLLLVAVDTQKLEQSQLKELGKEVMNKYYLELSDSQSHSWTTIQFTVCLGAMIIYKEATVHNSFSFSKEEMQLLENSILNTGKVSENIYELTELVISSLENYVN